MTKATHLFSVEGPHEIPLISGVKGQYFESKWPAGWDHLGEVVQSRGCYVFAFKAAKGYRPVYVGKATKCFGQECFAHHKVAQHYGPALMETGKGKPVMFFLVADKKGAAASAHIGELEKYLIRQASEKNPQLRNVQHKKPARWGIKGLLRSGAGAASASAAKLQQAVGL